MSAIDIKRAEMELAKVGAARIELEFKILEREEDIIRLSQHIQIQVEKEKELSEKIKTLKRSLTDV